MTTRNFRVNNGLSVGDIVIDATANTIVGLATAAPSADGDVSNKKYVDDQDANIAGDTLTFTNKTFDANGTGNSISNIDFADFTSGVVADEDNMSSNSATKLATQQSIKAYVDSGLSSLSSTTITEGNTSVVVADSGTGSITATVDGATVATFQPGDLALPNNVGLLFGTGGEKIESDGTNLTITSTGALDLTATGTTTVTNNFDVGGNMVISGDLTVQGTETIIATQNLNIEDAIIGLNSNVSDPNNMPRFSGIHLHRGNTSVATEVDLYMVWDDATNASGSTTNLGGCFTFMGSVLEAGSESPNSGSFILADVKASTIEANLTGNVTGNLTGAVTGNADTATALETARLIGGVSFNGTANINLPGVNTAGNQNTSGTAAIATTVTAADESSDTSCNVLFVTAATGNLPPKTGTNLTFNSANGTLTTTTFVGDLTGTATAAEYSDVAERFASDTAYEPGTVVALGGAAEITQVNEEGSDEVFGVISSLQQAAFKMNGAAGNDATHPYIAMTGRVNVKVIGTVNKGDRLISASVPGYAKAAIKSECTAFNVIGRALTSKTEAGQGTVLAAVRVSH